VPGVTVAVHDAPENILERITFYDIDSRRIEKHLTGEERLLYLKEIKADISYFKRSYERRTCRSQSKRTSKRRSPAAGRATAVDPGCRGPRIDLPRSPLVIENK
jgi:hypothetical protein